MDNAFPMVIFFLSLFVYFEKKNTTDETFPNIAFSFSKRLSEVDNVVAKHLHPTCLSKSPGNTYERAQEHYNN